MIVLMANKLYIVGGSLNCPGQPHSTLECTEWLSSSSSLCAICSQQVGCHGSPSFSILCHSMELYVHVHKALSGFFLHRSSLHVGCSKPAAVEDDPIITSTVKMRKFWPKRPAPSTTPIPSNTQNKQTNKPKNIHFLKAEIPLFLVN